MKDGKVVFITGGTGSLGKELVRAFYSEGYQVKFQYATNKKAAENLTTKFPGVQSYEIDFMEQIEPEIVGEFDVLINNAAFCNPEMILEEVSFDVWNRVMKVNLTAPYIWMKYILPIMKIKKWGRIINIASIYGVRPIETLAPYSTSKAGMIGLTKAVAREYAETGITCNAICPGTIDSDLMIELGKAYCDKCGMDIGDYVASLCTNIPMKRLADVKDISSYAIYLASDAAKYITGTDIAIDGGTII